MNLKDLNCIEYVSLQLILAHCPQNQWILYQKGRWEYFCQPPSTLSPFLLPSVPSLVHQSLCQEMEQSSLLPLQMLLFHPLPLFLFWANISLITYGTVLCWLQINNLNIHLLATIAEDLNISAMLGSMRI